jgi:DNA-binding transcriptional ArsR family regulator
MLDLELIPAVAARFKALGEPGRLSLLAELHEGERSVSELVRATRRSQPNVSQQLSSLARAGLVTCRREGHRVIYSISDPYLLSICDAVCKSLAARAEADGGLMGAASRRSRRG